MLSSSQVDMFKIKIIHIIHIQFL